MDWIVVIRCAGIVPYQEDTQSPNTTAGAAANTRSPRASQPRARGLRHRHQLPSRLHLLLHA